MIISRNYGLMTKRTNVTECNIGDIYSHIPDDYIISPLFFSKNKVLFLKKSLAGNLSARL